MKKKVKRTLTQLADAAFEQAAQKVIEQAEASGTTIIVWQNERITEVEPGKMRAALAKRKGRGRKK